MKPFPKPSQKILSQWRRSRRPTDGVIIDDDAQEVHCFAYEISCEPMSDRWSDALSPQDRKRIEDASQRLHDGDPATMVAEFEALVRELPDVPKLYNHLGVAYLHSGRLDDYVRTVKETYDRFPDYLFGMIGMGELALQEGRLDDIPGIFHHTLVLHELQDGRKEYHLSEITAFYAFFGRYFCMTGEPAVAAAYLDMLEELNPDHPLVENLRKELLLALFQEASQYASRSSRSRKGASKAKKKPPAKRRKR
uniref:Tetratricopeptide repeat protein n=1 Tax=Schlesneria paludicola TaxID=360056 RepID=A0A7C2K148_9PLAN